MNSALKEELSEILPDYSSVSQFLNEYGSLTMAEFDYYCVNKMSLFLVHEDYDFDALGLMLAKMEAAMPSLKRIFAKPIIQLKDEDEVLPVEAVRLVNSRTLNHIASHSELWDDYSDEGLKPNKLLTRTYKDNYSIYENVLFARTVDCMLSYLRKNIRYLKGMIYTSDRLEFNLLEKLDHRNYYLALGKLHTGYVRDFGKYYDDASAYLKRMELLSDMLSSRLKRNVYRLNKKKSGSFKLHDSNILHMQKDYHRVYLLYKNFSKILEIPKDYTEKDYVHFFRDYQNYITLLTLFSLISFGFEAKRDVKINILNPDVILTYKSFSVHLMKTDNGALSLIFAKDREKRIILTTFLDVTAYQDETYRLCPLEGLKDYVYVSISDVESFRRIERILYRGMLLSDLTFDTCAFCGHPMKQISEEDSAEYFCPSCGALVSSRICPASGEAYLSSSIRGFSPDFMQKDPMEALHYRNINLFTKDGDEICPVCGHVHEKQGKR